MIPLFLTNIHADQVEAVILKLWLWSNYKQLMCRSRKLGGGGQGVAIPPPAIKIIFHHPLERTSRSAHAIFENLKIKTEKK